MDDEATQKRLEKLRFSHAQSVELLRATTTFEHAALRPLFFLNGGALAAFVALFGSLKTTVSSPNGLNDAWAVVAIGAWIAGLIAAAGGTAFGYYSQLAFYKEHGRKIDAERARDSENLEEAGGKDAEAKCQGDKGQRHRRRAERLWITALVAFVLGIIAAILAIGML